MMRAARIVSPQCFVVLFAALVCSAPGVGARMLDRALVQSLSAGSATPALASVAADGGAVIALRGMAIPLVSRGESPGRAVRDWFAQHAVAFGLDPAADALVLAAEEPRAEGSHRVLIAQHWNGLPVEGGDARAIVDAAGRLTFVASGFVAGIHAPTLPAVSAERAIAAAANASGWSLAERAARATLWIRRREGVDRLAWEVRRFADDGRDVRCWVDATEGSVLETDAGRAFVAGRAYGVDPRQPIQDVELPALGAGPWLTTRNLCVLDSQFPAALPTDAQGNYQFDPAQPGFDQVNTLWQLWHFFREHLASRGYTGPTDSVVVRVHEDIAPNVAFTVDRFIYLSRAQGDFLGDVSRARDILCHEATHAVLFGFGVQASGADRQSAALHEGLADYFAASYTDDPALGDWLYFGLPQGATRVDQPAPPFDMDHYDHVSYGYGFPGSQWGNGMILSSAVWDVRRVAGAASTDSLVLEAVQELPTSPLFSHLANALLHVDQAHHAGRFTAAITEAFTRRGIRGGVVADFTGPSRLGPDETGRFVAADCCAGAAAQYTWSAREWCRADSCSEFVAVGSGPVLDYRPSASVYLRLEVANPWGPPVVAQRFLALGASNIEIDGPARIGQRREGHWTARFTSTSPQRQQWRRRWRRAGEVEQLVGQGSDLHMVADTSCDLSFTLVDALGNQTKRTFTVDTFREPASGITSGLFRVRSHFVLGNPEVETHVDLPRPSEFGLGVYDVRGRLRLRVVSGMQAGGAHVWRWRTEALEPGVYYLHGHGALGDSRERFIVLR